MILKALADYYQRMLEDPECDMAPPGFERKPIPFLIVINRDGQFINIRDTRREEGNKKVAREFIVPQGEKKTSGIKANLLWDNPQYVLGALKVGCQDLRDLNRSEESFKAFQERIDTLFNVNSQNDGIRAIQRFLSSLSDESDSASSVFEHPLWLDIWQSNANLSFLLEGNDKLIIHESDIIKQITDSNDPPQNQYPCSISGMQDIPSDLHPSIKGVWGAQPSGANIVSFNLDAFRSFGKKQGLNAPVGRKTVFSYTTALNTLLAKGSRQRMQVGDASTVFWAKDHHPFEDDFSCFLGEPPKGIEPDYGKIRALLTSVKTGVLSQEDEMPFHVLGLSPNASRIAIRFWYEGSIADLKQKLARHFEDIEIIRAPHDREYLSLFQLLVSIAAEGKADNIPPNLGGEVARAVLTGGNYPRSLFSGAIRRCKAEQRVTHSRAACIKGFLVRDSRLRQTTSKEIDMALDKSMENSGYVLGRLFAVFERIQEQANPGLNKTIRDTYFSAATSNPLVIFKRLQDLAIHHLAKIRNSGKSTVWLDKLLQEVMDKVPASGIPVTLSLEDQGRFAVGYYHQRQDFFTNKSENEKGEKE